jgi:hypothetical protein
MKEAHSQAKTRTKQETPRARGKRSKQEEVWVFDES